MHSMPHKRLYSSAIISFSLSINTTSNLLNCCCGCASIRTPLAPCLISALPQFSSALLTSCLACLGSHISTAQHRGT